MKGQRLGLVALLSLAVMTMVTSIIGLFWNELPAESLMNSSSALFGLSSIIQLKGSDWFNYVIEEYSDDAKYPSGPPSHVTRQLFSVENPE